MPISQSFHVDFYLCAFSVLLLIFLAKVMNHTIGILLQARFFEAAVAYKKKIGFNGIFICYFV